MAKKYKAKYVSADEYNIKNNYVSPEEYAQLEKQRMNEAERKRQERKRQAERAESLSRTKAWQKAYQDAKYSPNGDQSWQVYAAKQIQDTPGALEKEQKRANRIQAQANQNWRDFSREAKADGAPEVAYATKMINDSPVSKEDISKYGSAAKAKQAKLNEFLAGLNKTAKKESRSRSSVSMTPTQAEIRQRYIQSQQKKNGTGEQTPTQANTYEDYRGSNQGKLTIGNYNQYMKNLQKNIDAGMYDNGDDYFMMSDIGLKDRLQGTLSMADRYGREADTMLSDYQKNKEEWLPEKNWAGIFDMIEGWDEKNESAILRGNYTQEQQANADRTLRGLQQTRDARKQEMLDKAGVYFESFNQDMWKNDWENATDEEKEQLRQIMYDDIMPDSYADRVSRMTPEQKQQFDAAFDDMLDEATGTNLRWENIEDDYNTLKTKEAALQSQTKALEEEQKRRTNLIDLMKWASESGTSRAYDPGRVKLKTYSPDEWHDDYYYKPEGTETDKAYYYANNVPADLATVDPNEINKYYFIAADPEILEAFTSLYNYDTKRQGYRSNMADQFLKGLEPYLNYCMSHYQENWFNELAEDPVKGPIARLASYPLNAVGGIAGMAGTVLAGLGVESAQDPNSSWYITSKMATTTRQHQNEKMGDMLGDVVANWFDEDYRDQVREAVRNGTEFGLGVVDSILDNMFSKGVGTGIAGDDYKKTERIIQFIMSAEAMSNTMIEKLGTVKDPREAAIYAIADGTIEWFTEKASIDSWLGNDYKAMLGDKKALRKAIRNSMLAEGSEEINADVLNMGVDLLMSAINGHETELHEKYNKLIAGGMEPTQAGNKVLSDKVGEVLRSGLAGGMSGGLMVGGMYTGTKINQRQTGKQLNIKNEEGKTKTGDLVDLALQGDKDSFAFKQAEGIREQVENGKEVSDLDAGRLAQTLQTEAQETLNNADATREEIKKSMDTLRSVAEITGQIRKSTRDIGSRMASQQEIDEAEGERIQGQREAVYTDPKTGKATITKIDGVKLTQDDNKQWHLGLNVTVNGQQRTVEPSQLRMTNYKASEIINKAAAFPEFYSEGYTNLLLDAAENNQISEEQTEQAIDDAAMVRLYAYAGFMNSELPQTSLSKELANDIWKQSVEEHGTNRKGQVAGANRQEAGRATFDGVEYGTEEYNRKIAGLKLSKQTQEWMDTVAGIAQRAGIRADFTIADDDMTYGWESPEGIGLNISGMNYELDRNGKPKRTGQKHHLLVTFGHEMTHWLQRNSMQGYNRLEQYVLKSYINDHSAEELMMQLNNKMHRGEMLSLEDAISEFVANSCDQILGSEQVRDHIAKTDGKLFSQIKGFVKDLVNRFKNAIKGMDASASYEAQQMAGRMNELAKIWLGAYDEVLSGYTTDNKANQTVQTESASERYAKYQDRYKFETDFIDNLNLFVNDHKAFKAKMGQNEVLIGMTPQILIDIGLKNRPFMIDQKHINEILGPNAKPNHKMDVKQLVRVIKKANNPAAIIYSRSANHENNSVVIVVDEIVDNKPVVVPVHVTVEGEYNNIYIDINKMATAFGRNHFLNMMNDAIAVEEAGNKPGVYFVNDNKNKANFLSNQGVQFPNTAKYSGLMHTITDNPDFVNQKGVHHKATRKAIEGITRNSRYIVPNEKEGFSAESMVDDIDNMETEGNPSRNSIRNDAEIVKLDAEYADAVERGDLQKATDMLMEKLRKTQGVIPVMAPYWDSGEYRETAKQLKTGDPEAIAKAAKEMAKHVPENAVLIPMPGREGKVTNDSWTVKLANAISEITGRPVVIALEGAERGSRQEAKSKGEQGASQEELGFRQVAEIPEGTFPIFIDNVVGKGVTADAARQAMGGGITLAYTKTLRSPGIQGLKNAVVTYESESKGGGLIPLSQRFDVSKRDVRYSKANIEAEGDEMILEPLNIRRDIYFKGTEEEIDEADLKIEQRENELRNIIEAPDFTALMLKNKPYGRYEILHPSTRKGIRYQLTYYGPDGIPSMHESYGETGERADKNENVHSMEELYKHFSDQNFDSKLEMNVLRDNKQNNTRFSRAQADIDPRQQELSEAWQKARDEANELREKVRGMKPEMDAWVDRMTEAQKNGTFDELMPEYKKWEKGYTKLNNDLYEAEQRYKEANRAFDDYIEARDVAEEQKKIKASGMSEADYRRKQAVDEFGYTTDFREAGYLLPNGKMLNFTGEKGKHYGMRGEDHRGIGRIYASRENQGGAAMLAFMRDGNIRVMAETPGIDLITTIEPTAEQYEQIRNMARRFAGEHYFNVDLTDERGYTDDSIEYDGRVDPNRVVNDIKSFYKTGIVPTQSTVSQFHYSRWTEDAMDVSAWMANATASTVQTEDERILLDAFRGMRIKMSLSLKKQMDYKAKIRQLEGKENLTTEQKSELTALRNRLEIEQNKYARLEDEMFKVTNADGWAGMMYRENMLLKDYIQGKTQDQVRQTVEDMLKLVQRTQAEIEKDTADLKKLAEAQAVKTMKSFMGKTSLGKAAATLRKTYNSTMAKAEIEDRLAEIALKQASGKDITSDTETLAQDLLDKMRGIRSDALESLRGVTFVIGQSLADELKAENSSIKELQSRLKGSGVKLVTGVKSSATDANGRQIVDKHSRISEQWSELREKNGALPDVENMAEIDKLHTIVNFIESELRASTGAEQFNVDFDEVAAMVRAQASMVTTYLVDDPKARAQITNLMQQIAELSKKTEKTATDMERLYQQMDDVVLAGQKAKGWTTILQRDVNEAIRYYNKTAKVAAETERNRVRKELIEKLRSDHAKDMIKQAERFREQIANDKKARELQQDNLALRSKISTVATRMANRIFAETDQKNVPEEAKALVRQVIDMLSQHDGFFRKVTYWDKQKVDDIRMRIQKMIANYGQFNPDTDLNWLVVGEGQDADTTAQERVIQDLINIETGLMEYRNAEGKGRISLADRKAALTKVQAAISEIWDVVKARSEMEIAGRKWQVIEMAELMREEMQKSKFKGERTGFGSKARNRLTDAVTYGNLTPEYFFKNLKNRAMDLLHIGLKDAENRSGLEAARAKVRLAEIAKQNGFETWDGQEKHKIRVSGGREIEMTTEQIMALYATWLREGNQLRPEDTAHLLHGGFVLAEKEKNGKPGRQRMDTRPIRMNKDQLNALGDYLTDQQKQYVDEMVAYMSGELAELGNEASMRMYGIKKFTEQYYFPIKSWGGVLNSRSDAGISTSNENRAAQQGFSKRVKNNASNAIEIGDFTPTAIKHVAGMITYNTVGPAIENLNKVLNQQLRYGDITYTEDGEIAEDDTYKQNMRAAFQNAYGKQASDYLAKFTKDMNGGVTTEQNVWDKLLSIFKKNAVAGSLSVAAQQPLSYIRAAMMINPKYLAAAISPQYWKGSYAEMMKHSGVAVIKEMGKFDMNFGQTMQDWITPEGMESKARRVWNKTTDLITGLPGAMDMMTWTRMWSAVKLEQMAQNKGMDYNSEEFMKKVAERFNDLMRRTQVYDSVMTKSQNMRSKHPFAKTVTSFMAEPTLSLNVLADSFQNIKEKGGKTTAFKAIATFLLSAAAQAGAKAFFGAGRSPDKKKNREENFYNKFAYNLLSEVNPLGLIPGYRQIIETLTKGELTDDTMGVLAKASDVVDKIFQLATGKTGDKGLYRDLEDSIGQMLQLATDIPAKNLMRDFRAMVNWFSNGAAQGFTGDTYAQRETSGAMLKYQLIDTIMSNDLAGLINKKLGDAGYGTAAKDYYGRIYEAEKSGNKQAAQAMREYVTLNSKAEDPQNSMNEGLRKLAKADDSLTSEEKYQKQKEYGLVKGGSYILGEYEAGNLTRKEAEKLYREENPKKTDKEVLEAFDKIDYEKRTGKEVESYSNYTPLYDAIDNNKSDEIKTTVKYMLDNGYEAKDIKSQINSKIKKEYLPADSATRIRLKDAMNKAYKALGFTVTEADKKVQEWIKEQKKGTSKKTETKKEENKDTTGRWGKGNIDLNNRKVIKNRDGTISTEESFSVNIDGKEVLLPTIIDGERVSEDEAIRHYERTGQHLGKFNTVKEAEEYAEKLHNRQDWYYHK